MRLAEYRAATHVMHHWNVIRPTRVEHVSGFSVDIFHRNELVYEANGEHFVMDNEGGWDGDGFILAVYPRTLRRLGLSAPVTPQDAERILQNIRDALDVLQVRHEVI